MTTKIAEEPIIEIPKISDFGLYLDTNINDLINGDKKSQTVINIAIYISCINSPIRSCASEYYCI